MSETSFSQVPKAYNPTDVEDKWYKYWYDHELYHSEISELMRN